MENTFRLEDFDTYREDNRREVKKARGGLPLSLWETSGLKASDADRVLKSLWDMLNDRRKTSVNLLTDKDIKTYAVGEDMIIALSIPMARREQKPVYINNDLFGGTYRRNGEGDYHCSPSEVRAMLRDATEDTSDMKILEQFDLSVIDADALQSYRNRHKAWRPGHIFESFSNEDYLRAIGAAAAVRSGGRLHPTAAGLLMFGREYDIVREFPEFFLDYRELLDPSIRWTDRLQSSSGDWTGNVMDFFFRVNAKIAPSLKTPFALEGQVRVDDTPVHKAVREALVNCLSNADYFLPRGVVVRNEIGRLTIENPGGIRIGKAQMLRGGVSDPRNKTILKMFNLIGYGERAGTGVPDIYAIWRDKGWDDPKIETQFAPDRTIVTLNVAAESRAENETIKSDDKKTTIKSDDKKRSARTDANIDKIRLFLRVHGPSRTVEIAQELGLRPTRTKTLLYEMNDVEALGNNRNRRYQLKDSGK